jgi:hypothetical protein
LRGGIIAMAGVLFIAHAHAEPAPVLPPLSPMRARPEASLSPAHLDPADLTRVERKARWRRNVGIGLTVPGVTLLVLGGVLIGVGARDPRLVNGAGEVGAGSVAAGIGVIFTIPGALLWVGGQDDLDLTKWRRDRLAREATP